MKAKQFFPLLLCFLFPNAGNLQAVYAIEAPETVMTHNGPEGYEKINLIGDLMLTAGPDAISAWLDGNTLRISFSQSFGVVNIILYNSTGIVYNSLIDTSVQQLVIIPISGGDDETYTLWLSSVSGEAGGEF